MPTVTKRSQIVCAIALSIATCAVLFTLPAAAQSPAPTEFMEQFAPGTPTSDLNPYASALVVEGLGSLSCTQTEASIESSTIAWLADGYKVVTEIAPQPACGTIGQYEALLNAIRGYVEAHGSDPSQNWGGLMLDEEPQWFSYSQYSTLNSYVEGIMESEPGISYVFSEDSTQWSGGNWSLPEYNSVVSGTWLSPQVYNQNIANIANEECSTYSLCTNAITTSNYSGYGSWSSETYAESQVNGPAWQDSYWGSGYWYNEFCAVNCSTY